MGLARNPAAALHTLFVAREIGYDGHQLAPHWIYRQFDLLGDAAVAFIGPCRVALSEMVDIEDVKAQAPIYSPRMLHIIAEFFTGDLHLAVYRQRLLIVTAKELLEEALARTIGHAVTRQGDDLYLARADGQPGKLSVSIATASATSTLIHAGFNIETAGTPVPTVGLAELGIDAAAWAPELLARYAAEVGDIWRARCKVRAVTE
ncbi:MAG TPA: DUF366 family protein [Chloroflexia bacterium]|nr:DUF366 family protein [Chloroflexia bacterium]